MGLVGTDANQVTLNVRGASGQTVNLFNVEDNSGTDKFSVSNLGVTTATTLVTDNLTINDLLSVNSALSLTGDTPTEITLNVKGTAEQSAYN